MPPETNVANLGRVWQAENVSSPVYPAGEMPQEGLNLPRREDSALFSAAPDRNGADYRFLATM